MSLSKLKGNIFKDSQYIEHIQSHYFHFTSNSHDYKTIIDTK